MLQPRSEYIYNPFLIFVEHLDNPRAILEDFDPRRRKYIYLIGIRISPKDKSIKNIPCGIHEVECEVRFSNIVHVYGTDANLLSMCNYFPQLIAAFLNRYLNQSPNQIGLKYYYKFDKAKHLDDALHWQDVGGKIKTQILFPVTPRVDSREHVLIETMYDFIQTIELNKKKYNCY